MLDERREMSMYQGKNPSALTSQRLILDALNELLKEKEYKDITISELCSRSGVSRQTFYSLFGTKENVLLYQLEQSNDTNPSDEGTSAMSLTQICENYGKYVISNYGQLSMLIENELSDVLMAQFYRAMFTCHHSFTELSEEERDYASAFLSAGLCSLTVKYIKNHDKPDEKELARLSYQIMSGSVFGKGGQL